MGVSLISGRVVSTQAFIYRSQGKLVKVIQTQLGNFIKSVSVSPFPHELLPVPPQGGVSLLKLAAVSEGECFIIPQCFVVKSLLLQHAMSLICLPLPETPKENPEEF